MAGIQLFSNNALTTLAASITATATSVSMTSGGGSLFPAITGSNWFIATLVRAASSTTFEVVKVTGRSGDNFTIARGQEGTTAITFSAGDNCGLFPTGGGLSQFIQTPALQQQLTNVASDVGTAAAYSVTLSPPLTAHVVGMPIRFIPAHTNIDPCTFNDGVGVADLLDNSGGQITAGVIVANSIVECVWDGSYFILMSDSGANVRKSLNLSDVASATLALANIGGNNAANLNTGIIPLARLNYATSFAQNGYEESPNGKITQWGYAAATGTSPITVAFPLTFPNAVYNLQVTPEGAPASFAAVPVNNATFQIVTGAGNVNFYWQAIGR
jgi:hypothetical protein